MATVLFLGYSTVTSYRCSVSVIRYYNCDNLVSLMTKINRHFVVAMGSVGGAERDSMSRHVELEVVALCGDIEL